MQIYFLNSRFKGVVEIAKSSLNVIQDRTIYEDARIFAPNLHSMGLMSSRDYENYTSLFNLMLSLVKPPDLLIYLKSSVPNLVNQIQKRGRDYEASIRLDYLQGLNELYDKWMDTYNDSKKLIINVDEIKFEDNPKDLSFIIDAIDSQIHGIF